MPTQRDQPRFFFYPSSTPSPTAHSVDLDLSRQTSRSSHRSLEHGAGPVRLVSGVMLPHDRLQRPLYSNPSLPQQTSHSVSELESTEINSRDPLPRLSAESTSLRLSPGQAEAIDAVLELQWILYLGREEEPEEWSKRVEALKTVVGRLVESDCVYDTPLINISSRSKLISHFALLHLISTINLPSLTPSSILQHARSVMSSLLSVTMGSKAAFKHRTNARSKSQGKDLCFGEAWLGLPTNEGQLSDMRGWWRLWEVRGDCREIGEMQCFDGYHLAMIDQTITLRFLPSLCPIPAQTFLAPTPHLDSLPQPSPPPTSGYYTPKPLPAIAAPSFSRRLAGAVASEFEGALKWDLRVRTFVEVNEVGRVTRIRDVVDLRDAVETFVPFAKRIGWLGRCVGGLVSGVIGDLVLGWTTSTSAPHNAERDLPGLNSAGQAEQEGKEDVPLLAKEGDTEGIPVESVPLVGEQEVVAGPSLQGNLLGLENIGGGMHVAPDMDYEGFVF